MFGPGDHVTATTNDEAGLRLLLIAGKPIEEPVVQYGPFVMNTQVMLCSNKPNYLCSTMHTHANYCCDHM